MSFEYGIIKRRLLEGQTEDCEDWGRRSPAWCFPNILAIGSKEKRLDAVRLPDPRYRWTTRIRSTTGTTRSYRRPTSRPSPELLSGFDVYDVPFTDENGEYLLGHGPTPKTSWPG